MMDLIVEKTIKVNYVIDNTPAESKKLLSVSIPTQKYTYSKVTSSMSKHCFPFLSAAISFDDDGERQETHLLAQWRLLVLVCQMS